MDNKNALMWLKNGVIALAIAGLYSIVLVALRTPQLSSFFTDQSIFKSALVIHVNLSVLVWLLSITCCIWSYSSIKTGLESFLARLGFVSMVVMALSPLYPESTPVMNNYVPMLENIFFVIGLSLFGVVLLCLAIQTVLTAFMEDISGYGDRIVAIVKFTSALMFIGVWLCIFLSFSNLDQLKEIVPLDLDFYYEMLFWSGGHLLQFIYTQIFMLVLLVFVESRLGGRVKFDAIYEMLFALNFVLAMAVFVGHYKYDLSDGSFKDFFTLHMIYTAGIVPVIFIMMLLSEMIFGIKVKSSRFVSFSFFASILLFLSGGAIGSAISGVNVTIPAHYHGSIVGISVAFMGLGYVFCFQVEIMNNISKIGGVLNVLLSKVSLVEGERKGYKMASMQICLLTVGQILHIVGLALAGGYGVLRKMPGAEIDMSAMIYMGMVGIGGLIAIIGGLMFVYICAKNLYLKLGDTL